MGGRGNPKPVREYRFSANLPAAHLAAFREALVDLAGGFTEVGTDRGTRYIVGLRGRGPRQRLIKLLARSAPYTQQGSIRLERQTAAPDGAEIFFLLPLLRNPGGGPRQPLFTNEQLARLRTELASRFHFQPVMVRVYGEWRNNTGEPVPDDSLLIRIPRRSRRTIPNLRQFIRLRILGDPSCDQDYIYLSSRWRGEFIAPA